MSGLIGAVEAGGTKFRVGVGTGPDFAAEITIPTAKPEDTLGAAIEFLQAHAVDRVGIASFGPIDLNPVSETFGFTLATPKRGWTHIDIKGSIERALEVPVVLDTDVAAAGLGEWKWGAGQGKSAVLYVTIGTGIGGALLIEGRAHHGHGHSEMGHIAMEPVTADGFEGVCPFHSGCLEGLASGPAILARWGAGLPDAGSAAIELEAAYLAQAMRSLTYALAPDIILLGGGVMQAPGLLRVVRSKFVAELSGYSTNPHILEEPGQYLVAPAFGMDAGLVGALALGQG